MAFETKKRRTIMVSTRIDQDEWGLLNAYCNRRSLTMYEAVRTLLGQALERENTKPRSKR